MDQSSREYGNRKGGSDVDRTLKMISSGVLSSQNGRAEVSVTSVLKHTMYSALIIFEDKKKMGPYVLGFVYVENQNSGNVPMFVNCFL